MHKSKGLLVIVEVMGVVYRTYSDWIVASRCERARVTFVRGLKYN